MSTELDRLNVFQEYLRRVLKAGNVRGFLLPYGLEDHVYSVQYHDFYAIDGAPDLFAHFLVLTQEEAATRTLGCEIFIENGLSVYQINPPSCTECGAEHNVLAMRCSGDCVLSTYGCHSPAREQEEACAEAYEASRAFLDTF